MVLLLFSDLFFETLIRETIHQRPSADGAVSIYLTQGKWDYETD